MKTDRQTFLTSSSCNLKDGSGKGPPKSCGIVVGVGGEKRELELEEDAGLSSLGAAFGLIEDEVGVGRSLGSL